MDHWRSWIVVPDKNKGAAFQPPLFAAHLRLIHGPNGPTVYGFRDGARHGHMLIRINSAILWRRAYCG